MKTKEIEKYFFFGLLFATSIFAFLIFRPFWIVLVLATSLAIILYPMYVWLCNKRFPDWLASIVTVIVFTIVLCGPILGLSVIVFNQSQNLYRRVVLNGTAEPFMQSVENNVNKILPKGVTFDINKQASDFVSSVSDNIANIFTTTLSAFFSFLLMLLIIFYLLKDGPRLKKTLIKLSPLAEESDEKIIDKLTSAVDGVIRGSLFLALFQGVFVGLGLWFFGVPNGALWGVIAGVCSLIPPIGAGLISIPAIIFLFITGQTASAIGLFIWAIVILAILDTYLRPLLVSKKINVAPILILFSILGGISLLGPVGILVGPLSVSLLQALVSIYKNEFSN